MDEMKNLLAEEIKSELQKLKTLTPGSEEHKKASESIETLHKLMMDEVKTDDARQERLDRHELERDKHFLDSQTQDEDRRLKEAQYKTQTILQWVGVGVTVICGTLAPLVSNHVIHRRGLKYEETGSVASSHNRNCFSKMYYTLFK